MSNEPKWVVVRQVKDDRGNLGKRYYCRIVGGDSSPVWEHEHSNATVFIDEEYAKGLVGGFKNLHLEQARLDRKDKVITPNFIFTAEEKPQ